MKTLLALITIAAAASAQPAIAPPQIGFAFDGANSLRPIYGIAGNFLAGSPALTNVVDSSYSGSYGSVKTDTAIVTTNSQGQSIATTDAPAGPAFFAFNNDGSPAFAYLPSAHLLLEWEGTGFQILPFNSGLFPPDSVRAIFAPDSSHVGVLVQRANGLTDIRVPIATGEEDSDTVVPGVRGPAIVLSTGQLIYADPTGVMLRNPDGTEVHILGSIPAHFSLAQIGAAWVQLTDTSSGSQYAIRVAPGREGFYSLPEVNP